MIDNESSKHVMDRRQFFNRIAMAAATTVVPEAAVDRLDQNSHRLSHLLKKLLAPPESPTQQPTVPEALPDQEYATDAEIAAFNQEFYPIVQIALDLQPIHKDVTLTPEYPTKLQFLMVQTLFRTLRDKTHFLPNSLRNDPEGSIQSIYFSSVIEHLGMHPFGIFMLSPDEEDDKFLHESVGVSTQITAGADIILIHEVGHWGHLGEGDVTNRATEEFGPWVDGPFFKKASDLIYVALGCLDYERADIDVDRPLPWGRPDNYADRFLELYFNKRERPLQDHEIHRNFTYEKYREIYRIYELPDRLEIDLLYMTTNHREAVAVLAELVAREGAPGVERNLGHGIQRNLKKLIDWLINQEDSGLYLPENIGFFEDYGMNTVHEYDPIASRILHTIRDLREQNVPENELADRVFERVYRWNINLICKLICNLVWKMDQSQLREAAQVQYAFLNPLALSIFDSSILAYSFKHDAEERIQALSNVR